MKSPLPQPPLTPGDRARVVVSPEFMSKQLGIPIRDARRIAGAVGTVELCDPHIGPTQVFLAMEDGTKWWFWADCLEKETL
jgi:hypothetical protein